MEKLFIDVTLMRLTYLFGLVAYFFQKLEMQMFIDCTTNKDRLEKNIK